MRGCLPPAPKQIRETVMTALADTSARPSNYDSVAKLIHWTMALAIPTDWFLAVIRENFPQDVRASFMFWHKIGRAHV